MKKLKFKDVENYIKSFKYILISKKYKNCMEKLEIECPKKHIFKMSFSSFKKGARCRECYIISRRLTLFYIKQKTKEIAKGYICNALEYKNAMTKIPFICEKNHRFLMSWNHFNRGVRCPKCYKIILCENFIGEKNPNWQGGISSDPYCEIWRDKEYKKSIKQRDNHICKNENCWGTSNNLVIHHIDYNKKNCSPTNLITICYSCNGRANKNRKYWEKYYETKT